MVGIQGFHSTDIAVINNQKLSFISFFHEIIELEYDCEISGFVY